MLTKIKRTLSRRGAGASSETQSETQPETQPESQPKTQPEERRLDMENPETGCKGTPIFVPGSQPGLDFTWNFEGPYHTDKCTCLTVRDISLSDFSNHLNSLLDQGLVDNSGIGPLVLCILLRIPVGEKLQPPVDKPLRLADGEEFPPRIRPTSGIYQSFPSLDESDL